MCFQNGILEYRVAGLVNQLYSHIAAIMLARALSAELVLAPAMHRQSFNATPENAAWAAARTDTLLDVVRLKKYWRTRELLIHTVTATFLDLYFEFGCDHGIRGTRCYSC